jgi:hypothetical protein
MSFGYAWDPDGNRIAVGGIVYGYDGLDRLTDIVNSSNNGPIASFAYGPDGSVKSAGNMWSTSVTAATRFQRDAAGRVGRVT